MKNLLTIFTALLAVLLLAQCGSKKLPDNEFLGKIPSITADYLSEIEELELKAEESTDLKKAFEFASKAKKLSKEADARIEKVFEKLDKPVIVPFRQEIPQDEFQIELIEIKQASANSISISGKAKIFKPATTRHTTYICAIDSEGNDIRPFAVLMSSRNTEAGKEDIFTGIMKHPENLAGLAQFKLVSKDYYQENK